MIFFVPKAKDYLIELCDYLPRILSDHAPLLISVHQSPELPNCKLWRFSDHLLNNSEALNFINNNIQWHAKVWEPLVESVKM